jgi:hypothetical protein
MLTGLADGLPLAQQNIDFSKLVEDLFGAIPFPRHGSDLLRWLFTTFDLDQLSRAKSVIGPSPLFSCFNKNVGKRLRWPSLASQRCLDL